MREENLRADEDARLLAEAFALGQQNPAIWEAYVKGWEADVLDRINARFPAALPGGTVEPDGGADGDTGNPPPHSDPGNEG